MNTQSSTPSSNMRWLIKKLLLSAFVTLSFFAYVIYKPFAAPGSQFGQGLTSSGGLVAQPVAPAIPAATLPPGSTPLPPGPYKDGTYTGSQVIAYYGYVQVEVITQNGNITSVQVIQYPEDQGNSIRINIEGMPILQQEVIKAQNANVAIVTGATLSSQAFIQSLQAALDQAKG